jgi:hypothetical protein
MRNLTKKWSVQRMVKPKFYLSVLLALCALVVLPVGETHALNWGVYSAMHGDGIGTVSQAEPMTHFGGMIVARDKVILNIGTGLFDTYAYIKFDMMGPWAGNGENLNKALVSLKGRIILENSPLKVEIYHISDDNWNGSELTWMEQPLRNDKNFFPGTTQTIATLLITETIAGGDEYQDFDLLKVGSPYLDIWNAQDKSDHVISLMFKLSGSDLGKAGFWQEMYDNHYSLILQGTTNPSSVPIPGAIWLLGSGLAGLAGLRKRFKK